MIPVRLTLFQRKKIEQLRRESRSTSAFNRLSVLLWLDDGKTLAEVAELLGLHTRTIRNWVKLYHAGGLPKLLEQKHRGDPGNLNSEQKAELLRTARTGIFRSVRQIIAWVKEKFDVTYSLSGMKDMLKRIGLTYHKVKGFLWKGNPVKQREFVVKYRGQRCAARKRNAKKTRFYFVDACHPVWGLDHLYYCWLPRGEDFLAEVGPGRQRLNILAAYNPDDHELVKVTGTGKGGNIDKYKFELLLEMIKELHPETERFVLYLDNATYFKNPYIREWLKKNPKFHLEFLPPYSPNLNLIERLWGLLRKKTLQQFHPTFESMENEILKFLDNLSSYENELKTLMTENFHIVENVPNQYNVAA